MIQSKVKDTFKELGINFNTDFNSSNNCLDLLICDNIKNYKKGLKYSLKIYKNFNSVTLIFKIGFIYNEDNSSNLENTITILNRFIDICKLKKPIFMNKYLCETEDNILKETIFFYWDLSKEKIKIKNLIKEILFLNNDGFIELTSSVFFIDTNNCILLNFYDDKIIKILSNNNDNFKKIYKKYKKLIINKN